MRLRDDLPFRRIAVVLAGGGAYGAYEAGALRTLSAAGLAPAGVTGPLERAWRELRPARLGIRWAMLMLRAVGGFLIAMGTLEALLVLAGIPAETVVERFWSIHRLAGYLWATNAVDFMA